VRVRSHADLLRADALTPLGSSKAQKPTAGSYSECIKHGGLPCCVVTHEQIEAWIETECALRKTVKVFDREMVNLHL
jgi:hypothetical protein